MSFKCQLSLFSAAVNTFVIWPESWTLGDGRADLSTGQTCPGQIGLTVAFR